MWLGAADGIAQLSKALVKQNPEPLEEKVMNFPAMAASLARLDRFNLSRTPNFEPRRGPAVPGFVAAARAPLLFMPVKAGPTARVERWLAALEHEGEAALRRDFTQKTLREWLRDAPGHRKFTVLRHPVARAHAAFCELILSGLYGEIYETLRKPYKLPLPPLAKVGQMDLAAHRAAFLAFAGFLKANLSGQTSVRVDAGWASQAAVVQGFGQFAQPDVLIREERLEKDLAALAGMVGKEPPALEPEPARQPFELADVYDAEIEAALAQAYQRDYLAFGFGPWRG
jgi:hypothetical protein